MVPNRIIKYTNTLLAILLVVSGFSQKSVSSGNSKMMLTMDNVVRDKVTGEYRYETSLYSRPHKSLLKRFYIESENSDYPDKLELNHNGKIAMMAWGADTRVFNTITGQLLYRGNKQVKVALAHNDNFFVISNELWIKAFDAYTGEQLIEYETAPINYVRKLMLSPNDEHLFTVTDRKQTLVWEIGRERPRKKYFSTDVSITNESFTIERIQGRQATIYRYSLPEFKRLEKFSLDRQLRDHAKDKTIAYREKHPEDRRKIIRPDKFYGEQVFINQSGNKCSFFTETERGDKGLMVMDITTGKIIYEEVIGNMKTEVNQEWYNDSLLLPAQGLAPKVFNANRKQYDETLNFILSKDLRKKRRKGELAVSPDFQFSITLEDDENIILRREKGDMKMPIPDFDFLSFSDNSKYIYLKDRLSGERAYFALSDFGRGLSYIKYFSEDELPIQESMMPEPNKPANFNANRITGFKHISEAEDGALLKIVMKSLITGPESGIQVQVMDEEGNYYYGAGDPQWRKLWCNLMVKGSDGTVRQVDEFDLTEHQAFDSIPNAIALVADFSGSMGWPRADALQDGLERFLKNKKNKDKIALFKYDHRIVRECNTTDNQNKLIRRLFKTDYSMYGGSTALLDAAMAGIHSVKSARNVSKKIVILFTDGIENASLVTKNEVIGLAVENGVSVYTVAYGDMINKNFLKSIAYNTRGGFYQTFDVKDFEWIFKDIYAKAENYYSIKYENDDKGSQVQYLKICHQNLRTSDSLAIEFTNDPVDVETLLNSDNVYVENPVTEFDVKVSEDEFYFPNREPKKMRFLKSRGVKILKIHDDQLSMIEDEFETIELPTFNFQYDNTNTIKDTEARIEDLLQFLQNYPEINLRIIGHTDNKGTLEYNNKLSQDRANMVKDLLVRKGIAATRLRAEGMGEISPIATNDTPEGRALNRRVEFRIVN